MRRITTVASRIQAHQTDERSRFSRRAVLALPLALAGCGFIGGDETPPLPGKRIDVMASSSALEVDPSLTEAVTVPAAVPGLEWPQQGGNAAHDPGISALPPQLAPLWRADFGSGTAYRQRIPCPPVVAGGAVFTMGADGAVSAFDIHNGASFWSASIHPKHSRSLNVGGGISYADGHIYAATGLGEIICFDAKSGTIRWRQPLGVPARSGPTISGGHIFVSLIDSSMVGLDAHTGRTIWSHQANNPQTGVLGLPAPAVAGSIVVAGFGSGDLIALNTDTGEVLWTDNLGATGTGLSQLSAIVGLPVIDQGRVFVGSLGGIVLSLDLPTGRRLWEKDFATDQTSWVAGDWVFQLSTDQQLAALSASTGQVKWARQLPSFKNMKKLTQPIYWWGPVLAGGSLVLVSNNKQLVTVSPVTGEITSMIRLPAPAAAPAIAAEGRIFVTLATGDLLALG
ncbi:PQQ-binding-like beta-propeller repeat protein [Acidisoma sp.]|uniref:PQQ-binding-like beta-propeller repeat protein n=1 Tax=Acidisoma sp. TaxID=1872115 RepID=UPI003AFFA86A